MPGVDDPIAGSDCEFRDGFRDVFIVWVSPPLWQSRDKRFKSTFTKAFTIP
jgi:hypothetical protein